MPESDDSYEELQNRTLPKFIWQNRYLSGPGYYHLSFQQSVQSFHQTVPAGRHRILIEASKLLDEKFDGVKRYVHGLIVAMDSICRRYDFDIHVSLGLERNFRLHEIAGWLKTGRFPMVGPSRLLCNEADNPLIQCEHRLQAPGQSAGLLYARLKTQARYLKALRSIQNQWLKLRKRVQPHNNVHYDLVHLTLPNNWKSIAYSVAPLLVTVHDLSYIVCPQFQNRANIRTLRDGVEFAIEREAKFVAVSESTKQQMLRRLGVDEDRIRVVHEACERTRFRPVRCSEILQKVRDKYGIPDGPFVLSLGTVEPRKNVVNVVHAFRKWKRESNNTSVTLVIVGTRRWGDHRELKTAIDSCPHICSVGYVADEDLPALYSAAITFCYVSHYEGFGLPLLEAMSCGIPTIYGNRSAMPEIVGNAGLPATPHDVSDICRQLQRLLGNESLRRTLARAASDRAKLFDWRQTAEQTLCYYDDLLNGRHSARHILPIVPESSETKYRNAA